MKLQPQPNRSQQSLVLCGEHDVFGVALTPPQQSRSQQSLLLCV
jgi:hypothetical protein